MQNRGEIEQMKIRPRLHFFKKKKGGRLEIFGYWGYNKPL